MTPAVAILSAAVVSTAKAITVLAAASCTAAELDRSHSASGAMEAVKGALLA
jgi:hypothetical protein